MGGGCCAQAERHRSSMAVCCPNMADKSPIKFFFFFFLIKQVHLLQRKVGEGQAYPLLKYDSKDLR